MSRIGGKDTAPELVVRKTLHSLGYRFRLHRRDMPGTPDIVLPRYGKVVFVHGCFWHGHGCKIGKPPKSNVGFWEEKLAKNKERDARNAAALRKLGWDVVTVWQCQTRDRVGLVETVEGFMRRTVQENPIDIGPPDQYSF
jgi:DNA mismatch endonuclease, patch repair protein